MPDLLNDIKVSDLYPNEELLADADRRFNEAEKRKQELYREWNRIQARERSARKRRERSLPSRFRAAIKRVIFGQ